MLDPFLIGTIVIICTILTLLFSFLQSKKNGFDEVWNEQTKKLLNGQKEKSKPNSSPTVAKKKEAKNKAEPKAVKQKPKEINLGMLQTRLAAITDLEPEYLSFLQGHLQKLDQQVKDLSDTVAHVTAEKATVDKLVDSLKSGRAASESKIAELKNANTELGAKINKLNSTQNDLATKWKRAEADKQTALDTVRTVKEESRDIGRQITAVNKEMISVKERCEQQKRELVEKIRKMEENAHIHHVDITAVKVKNEELHKQTLYLEKVAMEKEEQLKNQRAALERERDDAIQQYKDERRLQKEDEDKLAIEMDETRHLLVKITDELAVFERNNRTLAEHNEKAVDENRKLFEQNKELVAANLEMSVRCDTLEEELLTKADELANQLKREMEKERKLTERNAKQEELIKRLQGLSTPSCTDIDIEFLQMENMRLTEMLAELDPLFTSPKALRAPPPSPESAHASAGDSRHALLKLQKELLCLEKQHRERQRDDLSSAFKSLKEAQSSHMEDSLMRAQAEIDTIDQVKATVEQAMETLLADGLAQ